MFIKTFRFISALILLFAFTIVIAGSDRYEDQELSNGFSNTPVSDFSAESLTDPGGFLQNLYRENDVLNLLFEENAGWQSCRPNSNQIALFYDANYRGRCVVKRVGRYSTSRSIGLPDNSISSIIVGRNVRATLCRNKNYKSTCQTFNRNDRNLAGSRVGNDKVSSAIVEYRSGSGGGFANHAPPNRNYTFCANERSRCTFSGTGTVAYGVNGRFFYRRNVRGSINCNNQTFGDPVPGIEKRCYVQKNRNNNNNANHYPPNSNYRFCANERGRCSFSGRKTVAFGVNGRFFYRRNVRGSINCNTQTFGDPVPGIAKRCYVQR